MVAKKWISDQDLDIHIPRCSSPFVPPLARSPRGTEVALVSIAILSYRRSIRSFVPFVPYHQSNRSKTRRDASPTRAMHRLLLFLIEVQVPLMPGTDVFAAMP